MVFSLGSPSLTLSLPPSTPHSDVDAAYTPLHRSHPMHELSAMFPSRKFFSFLFCHSHTHNLTQYPHTTQYSAAGSAHRSRQFRKWQGEHHSSSSPTQTKDATRFATEGKVGYSLCLFISHPLINTLHSLSHSLSQVTERARQFHRNQRFISARNRFVMFFVVFVKYVSSTVTGTVSEIPSYTHQKNIHTRTHKTKQNAHRDGRTYWLLTSTHTKTRTNTPNIKK